MSRIRKAYEAKLRALLLQMGARRLDEAIDRINIRLQEAHPGDQVARTRAVDALVSRLDQQNERFQSRHGAQSARSAGMRVPRFICDVGLGGLARWLRASGYDAEWIPGIEDEDLVRLAQRTHRTILTTDSPMMDRKPLREGLVPALWVPPTLTMREQLAIVLRELKLPMRSSLCMRCGGRLRKVKKEEVWDRIPPRTRLWLDEYFLCERCGQLFWEGTHWRKIRGKLNAPQSGAFDEVKTANQSNPDQ